MARLFSALVVPHFGPHVEGRVPAVDVEMVLFAENVKRDVPITALDISAEVGRDTTGFEAYDGKHSSIVGGALSGVGESG